MKAILLATFENTFQAGILQGALKNEGIESFLRNDAISSVFPNMPGFQVQLMVLEEDYVRAKEILQEGFPNL